jgi:hypothetical protein
MLSGEGFKVKGAPVYEANFLGYNLLMNKRAKKRMKEDIKKEITKRSDNRKEQGFSSPTKKLPESRGFTVRPDKKRG